MWILLSYAILGFLIPDIVYCQSGTSGSSGSSGSSIKWQASIGSSSSGGSSRKTHSSRLIANQQKVPEYPTTMNRANTLKSGYSTKNSIVNSVNGEKHTKMNRLNTLKSKKPLKFSREFLKLLLEGTNDIGPLRSRVWTTTTTTERPRVVTSNTNSMLSVPLPPPSKLLTDPPNMPPPPPPIDAGKGNSGFLVGKRGPGKNIEVHQESKNIKSNGISSTKQNNDDSSNRLTNGNGAKSTSNSQDKSTKSKPKTHSRKQAVGDIEPVLHIGEKVKSHSSLGGGMSLFDVVNSKPGFEEFVRLSKGPDLTAYTTVSTTTVSKSTTTTTTTTAAPVTPRLETTKTTSTTTTTPAPKKQDPVFMVQSSLSQPLQFAEQLRQQGINVDEFTDLAKGGLQIGRFNPNSNLNIDGQFQSRNKEVVTPEVRKLKQRTLAPHWPPPFMDTKWPTLAPIWGYQSTPTPNNLNGQSNSLTTGKKMSGKKIKSIIENMYNVIDIVDGTNLDLNKDLARSDAFNVGKYQIPNKTLQRKIDLRKTSDSTNALFSKDTLTNIEPSVLAQTTTMMTSTNVPRSESSLKKILSIKNATAGSTLIDFTSQMNNETKQPFTSFLTEFLPSLKPEKTTNINYLFTTNIQADRTSIMPSVQSLMSTQTSDIPIQYHTTTSSYSDISVQPSVSNMTVTQDMTSEKQGMDASSTDKAKVGKTSVELISLPTTTLPYIEAAPDIYDQSWRKVQGIPIPMDSLRFYTTEKSIKRLPTEETTQQMKTSTNQGGSSTEQHTQRVDHSTVTTQTIFSPPTTTIMPPISSHETKTLSMKNNTTTDLLENSSSKILSSTTQNLDDKGTATTDTNVGTDLPLIKPANILQSETTIASDSSTDFLNDFIGASILMAEWKKPSVPQTQPPTTISITESSGITVADLVNMYRQSSPSESPLSKLDEKQISDAIKKIQTENIFVNGSFVRNWKHIGNDVTTPSVHDEFPASQSQGSDSSTSSKHITRKPRATADQRAMMAKLVEMLKQLSLFFSRGQTKAKLPFRLHDNSGRIKINSISPKQNNTTEASYKIVTDKSNKTDKSSTTIISSSAGARSSSTAQSTTSATSSTSLKDTSSSKNGLSGSTASTTSTASASSKKESDNVKREQTTVFTQSDIKELERALRIEIRQQIMQELSTIGKLPPQMMTTSQMIKEKTSLTADTELSAPKTVEQKSKNNQVKEKSQTTQLSSAVQQTNSIYNVEQGTTEMPPVHVVGGLSPAVPVGPNDQSTSTSMSDFQSTATETGSSPVSYYTAPAEQTTPSYLIGAEARATLQTVDEASSVMSPKVSNIAGVSTESMYVPLNMQIPTEGSVGVTKSKKLVFDTNKGPPPAWLFDNPTETTTTGQSTAFTSFIQSSAKPEKTSPNLSPRVKMTTFADGSTSEYAPQYMQRTTDRGLRRTPQRTKLVFDTNKGPPPSWLFDNPIEAPTTTPSSAYSSSFRSRAKQGGNDASTGGLSGLSNAGMPQPQPTVQNQMNQMSSQMMTIGLGSQEPSAAETSSSVANNKMDALVAKLKGNSGGAVQGGQNNNNMQMAGGANKAKMNAFLNSLSADQRRMFRTILGGPPTTTTVAPPTGNFESIVRMMKAMGIDSQALTGIINQLSGGTIGPDQGPMQQQTEGLEAGPFTGPPQFDGPNGGQIGPNQGPGPGQNNRRPQFGGNGPGMGPGVNNGGNMGQMGPGGNNNRGGGPNNFGMGGGGGGNNRNGGGPPGGFGNGGQNNGQGLGGPDISQMMNMLSGGGGGSGGMNPMAALMGGGNEGLGGNFMGGMGGGPMGGGRGMRGQRRMMPGGPNADPQTRRLLMQRLIKRGQRPGADPADPPEAPSMGEALAQGMMGGSGGMPGMMNPSTAWMGNSGGGGGFNPMNMGGGGGGEGGLAGMMNMFGGGGAGGAGGLAALMGGEGGMNPMMLSLLSGGDPADAPAGGRRMGGFRGGGRRGVGGMPMLQRREAGPGPKPNGTSESSQKTKTSTTKSKISPATKIHSNTQSRFSFSLAIKSKNAMRNLRVNENKPTEDFHNQIKNSKAIIEFMPLDLLPDHLLPKLKSLDSMKPKHRRRPAPKLPSSESSKATTITTTKIINTLAAPINTTKFKTGKITSKSFMKPFEDKSPGKLHQTILNKKRPGKSENNSSDYSISLQKRFTMLDIPLRRQLVNKSWRKSKATVSFGSLNKPTDTKNSSTPSNHGQNNTSVRNNGRFNQNNRQHGNSLRNANGILAAGGMKNQRSGNQPWKPPSNIVVNSPHMAVNVPPQWSQAHYRSMDPPSPVRWQSQQRNSNPPVPNTWPHRPQSPYFTQPRYQHHMQPPQPYRQPIQPSHNSQSAWGTAPLPRPVQRQGPPLPNSWQQSSTHGRQWNSRQPSQSWQQPQTNWQNTPSKQQSPSQLYTPQYPKNQPPTQTQSSYEAWKAEQQNNYPPQTSRRPWFTTQRPWNTTPRPWQPRPSNPPPNTSNQFNSGQIPSSRANIYAQQENGQSSWVEINTGSRQNSQPWNEGPASISVSNSVKGPAPADLNQQFPQKQPNVLDNIPPTSGNNQFISPSNGKAAFQQSVPPQPQEAVPPTHAPVQGELSSGSLAQSMNTVTQAPPPPQWPADNPTLGKSIPTNGQSQNWDNINQQQQAWTDKPQFAGVQQPRQQTTTQPPIMTNSWNAASSFGGLNTNPPMNMPSMNSGAAFSYQNVPSYVSQTTVNPYNNINSNQNFAGPTTRSNFQSPVGGSPSVSATNPAMQMAAMMADPLTSFQVSGPGVPPGFVFYDTNNMLLSSAAVDIIVSTLPADQISDIMGGGAGHAYLMPRDIKLQVARLKLAGISADQIAEIIQGQRENNGRQGRGRVG